MGDLMKGGSGWRGRAKSTVVLALNVALLAGDPLAGAVTKADDCEDLYYGFSAPPNLKRAYSCFEAQHIFEYLIVMRLNGEGTKTSVDEADKLVEAWTKFDPEASGSTEGKALRAAIKQKRDGAQAGDAASAAKRVNFCRDIAGDTPTVEHCLSVESRQAEAKQARHIAAIAKGLSAPAKKALDDVQASFSAFKDADGRRMYQLYADGTIRGAAAIGQEAFVRERFAGTFTEVVEKKVLRPATPDDLKAADEALAASTKANLAAYEKTYAGKKGEIAAYKKAADDASSAWEKYRDAWVAFTRVAYAKPPSGLNPETSIKTLLTRVRQTELKHDPVAPDQPQ